jgi:hypothetical protein
MGYDTMITYLFRKQTKQKFANINADALLNLTRKKVQMEMRREMSTVQRY